MSPHLRRRKTHCVGWEQLLSSVLACWWSQRCWVRASLLPGLGASPPFPPSIPPPWIVYVCHWVFVSLFVLCACDFVCVGCWGRVGVSVPVSVPVCVCVCVGWEQKSPHPAHLLSLCLCTAQLSKQKYKNTKRNKKTSSLFASVQFCYIKYKNTTTFNQSENLFSFYHYSEWTESVTMTLVLKLRGDCSRNGSYTHNYFNIVALVLCAPFTFVWSEEKIL